MKVKYTSIKELAMVIYRFLGNEINTLENIEDSIYEVVKTEKCSLADAVDILLPEFIAQTDTEIVFA